MKLSATDRGLLGDLLKAQEENPLGAHCLRFQAAHENDLNEIDRLRSNGLIEQRDRVYAMKLLGLAMLASSNATAQTYLEHCSTVFALLRRNFKEDPEQKLPVSMLSAAAGLPDVDLIRALTYLRDAPIWGGYSTDLTKPDSYVVAGGLILQHKTLDSILNQQHQWALNSEAQREALMAFAGTADSDSSLTADTQSTHPYVEYSRLNELRSLSGKWDLSRLCKLCEELNTSYQSKCFMAVTMLIRGILDHVPPAFGCKNFSEVANQYGGPRSFKESMQRLDESLRPIANGHLHTHLRASESLPTRNQVEFRAELDVLLSEIIRLQRGSSDEANMI